MKSPYVLNLKNDFKHNLDIFIYNYYGNGLESFETNIVSGKTAKIKLLFNNLLIFFKNGKNYGLFTPIKLIKGNGNTNSNINLTNEISNLRQVSISGGNTGSGQPVGVIMNNIAKYVTDCAKGISISPNFCVNLEILLKDLFDYRLTTNYPCWCYDGEDISDFTTVFSRKNKMLQFIVPYKNDYFATGIVDVTDLPFGETLEIIFVVKPESLYYQISSGQSTINVSLSINVQDYLSDVQEYGYLEMDRTGSNPIYIDSNIFGEKVFLSATNNFVIKYYIFQYNNSSDITYQEINFKNLIPISMVSNYMAVAYQSGDGFKISQIIEFSSSPKIAKLRILNKEASSGSLILAPGMYSDLSWTMQNVFFDNIKKFLKNSFKYVTVSSAIPLDLYIYNFESDNYITYYKKLTNNIPLYLLYKNLQIIYYDGTEYGLLQIMEIGADGLTLTLSTASKTISPSIVNINTNTIILPLQIYNIGQYINIICTNITDYVCDNQWVLMGSTANLICVDNDNLLRKAVTPKFIFYSQVSAQLYFINYENNIQTISNIALQKVGNVYVSDNMYFDKKFLQIIYTVDGINFGMYALCNLFQALATGCVINLIPEATSNRRIVDILPGNNSNYIINQNINNAITFQSSADCVNNSCTPLTDQICINEKMIKNLSSNNTTLGKNSAWIITTVEVAIVIGFLFIIVGLFAYFYTMNMKKKDLEY